MARESRYCRAQILLGRTVMPAYREALNDRQIGAVASYIRNSWGNHFVNVDQQAGQPAIAVQNQTCPKFYELSLLVLTRRDMLRE